MINDSYETVGEINGLKFELVKTKRGMFQACTFGIEPIPTPVRRTLKVFQTEVEARAYLSEKLVA